MSIVAMAVTIILIPKLIAKEKVENHCVGPAGRQQCGVGGTPHGAAGAGTRRTAGQRGEMGRRVGLGWKSRKLWASGGQAAI